MNRISFKEEKVFIRSELTFDHMQVLEDILGTASKAIVTSGNSDMTKNLELIEGLAEALGLDPDFSCGSVDGD